MNPEAIAAVISGAGFLISTALSSFIAGIHWGETRTRLDAMEKGIARLEGMFTMVPKIMESQGNKHE